jgi:hypothetical protein
MSHSSMRLDPRTHSADNGAQWSAVSLSLPRHPAFEHPHELLVRMRMSSHIRSGPYLPPHYHALLAGQHPARNLLADFFLRCDLVSFSDNRCTQQNNLDNVYVTNWDRRAKIRP